MDAKHTPYRRCERFSSRALGCKVGSMPKDITTTKAPNTTDQPYTYIYTTITTKQSTTTKWPTATAGSQHQPVPTISITAQPVCTEHGANGSTNAKKRSASATIDVAKRQSTRTTTKATIHTTTKTDNYTATRTTTATNACEASTQGTVGDGSSRRAATSGNVGDLATRSCVRTVRGVCKH